MHLTERPFITTDVGTGVLDRLRTERYGWLTTVAPSGLPVPAPVWFDFDGATVTIYCRPNDELITHVFEHPEASLHLESDGLGDRLVIIGGRAAVTAEGVDPRQDATYWAKYHVEADAVGMTESIASHSARITLTPSVLRTNIPT